MYTEHYKPASKMAPRNDMSGASTELVLFFVRTAYTEPASRTVAHLERFHKDQNTTPRNEHDPVPSLLFAPSTKCKTSTVGMYMTSFVVGAVEYQEQPARALRCKVPSLRRWAVLLQPVFL